MKIRKDAVVKKKKVLFISNLSLFIGKLFYNSLYLSFVMITDSVI